jgi:hypothetical protein
MVDNIYRKEKYMLELMMSLCTGMTILFSILIVIEEGL